MTNKKALCVIGGGAAGFFGALAAAENPAFKVLLIERGERILSKVKISGGGRCNVTHGCFDPRALIRFYPRGSKELLGPFSQFQPKDTMEWFQSRGVNLKIEEDGRVFPETDSSQTIIDCLTREAKHLSVEVSLSKRLKKIEKKEQGFLLFFEEGPSLECERVLLATGSHPLGYALAKELGHSIVLPVPSLFTLKCKEFALASLSGISVPLARLTLPDTSIAQEGPLLITHFGFSGPAALRLSAWGARVLFEKNYQTPLLVDWIPNQKALPILERLKVSNGSKLLGSDNPFGFAKQLWKELLACAGCSAELRYAHLSRGQLLKMEEVLHKSEFWIEGKTPHKEEFVTCGGVELSEVNFRTMESKLTPGLFFAGEILNIDGITGGFNFQNAWTTGWLAGKALSSDV